MSASMIGNIGLASTIAGGALKSFGAGFSGMANANMYRYQASLARMNQQIALQNADYASQLGEQQAMRYGMKAGQQFSGIRAAQSASGIDINSGSSKAVQDSQKLVAGMDTATIRSNAAKTAYDYVVKATELGNQAKLYKNAAMTSEISGALGVAGSVIGTAGSVADKWLQAKQVNLFGSSNGDAGDGNEAWS